MNRIVAQNDLLAILVPGCNVIIDVRGRGINELIALAARVAASGGMLTLRGVGSLSPNELQGIANSGKSHITFDFT